jgi:hypothetical protein
MRGVLAWLVACSIAVAAVAAPRIAAADSEAAKTAATRAAALFEEGRVLGKAERWAEACTKFAESLELVAAVGTQLNLADCLEREGKLRRAWQLFAEAAEETERTGPELRAKFARERADALEGQLAIVVVKLADPDAAGLEVAIDGRRVRPAARIRELVEPGAVDIAVRSTDRAAFRRTVRAKRGEKTTVEVPALAAAGGGAAGRERSRGWVYTASVFALTGIVLLGYGALEETRSLRSFNAASEDCITIQGCPPYIEAGHAAERATTAGFYGFTFVVLGAAIYAVAPKRTVRRVTVAPAASARGAGIGISGTF